MVNQKPTRRERLFQPRAAILQALLLLWVATILSTLCFAQSGDTLSSPAPATVDSEDFYSIYDYDTPPRGWYEPNVWVTYVPESRNGIWHFNSMRPREGLTAYTTEVEYGITDHLSLSMYTDFMNAHGRDDEYIAADGTVAARASGMRFTQGRVEARYRLAEPGAHFFDVAAYAEYYFPCKSFSTGQELETRLILEKNFAHLRLDLNPTLSYSTTGAGARAVPNMNFNTGVYYERNRWLKPGIEYYSGYSALDNIPAFKHQQHLIFPTTTFAFTHNFEWQLGVGFGLTPQSDQLTIKTIVTYQFQGRGPSHFLGRRVR